MHKLVTNCWTSWLIERFLCIMLKFIDRWIIVCSPLWLRIKQRYFGRGLARGGGGKWGTRPGAQALATHQHAFCSHLNTRF